MSNLTIDPNNLKVKHISGQYKVLPSSPEPDDILFYCFSKKRKQFTKEELIKFFGEEQIKNIEESIRFLDVNDCLQKTGEEQYKVIDGIPVV